MPARNHKYFDAHTRLLGPKEAIIAAMDAFGLSTVLNVSQPGFMDLNELMTFEARLREGMRDFPGRFVYCPSFSIRRHNAPGYAYGVIAKLKRDIREYHAVAVAIGEELGTVLRDAEGRFVFCDDPAFTPIFDFCAKQGLTILLCSVPPQPVPGSPAREELLEHRDALLRRHRDLNFVCCRMADLDIQPEVWMDFLDTHPNACIDTAGCFDLIQYQPHSLIKTLFQKHSDRILFGTGWEINTLENASPPDQAARFRRYLEEQLALPSPILDAFYHGNTTRLFGLTCNS
jgi:predicted TIM-barrel fold metal-dependent hydrolase